MKVVLRLFLTLVCAASAYFFTYWVGGGVLYGMHGPLWLIFPIAAVSGLAVGAFVWKRSAAMQAGAFSSIALGALVTGGVGFACGFFGPILFMPDANQGPLLGILFTGPLGLVLGAIGGGVYWAVWGRRRVASPPARP